eukprot:3877145-Rhodomonas_salina.1
MPSAMSPKTALSCAMCGRHSRQSRLASFKLFTRSSPVLLSSFTANHSPPSRTCAPHACNTRTHGKQVHFQGVCG